MAIIGKSADEVRGLLGNAGDLAVLVEILQDPKKLKAAITEMDGVDELLAQKKDVLKALDRAEKLEKRNIQDAADNEKKLMVLSKSADDLQTMQKTVDAKISELDAREKEIAKSEAAAAKALKNAETTEASTLAKSQKLDNLIADNEVKQGYLDSTIAAYKNKLSVLDQVA